jgi:hypothetical protein
MKSIDYKELPSNLKNKGNFQIKDINLLNDILKRNLNNENIYKKEEKITKNEFISHKRLIKRKDILRKREIRKNFIKKYFDDEAELGSDNEEHDNIIKNINSDTDTENDDGFLEDLIDDKSISSYNEQNDKFINDMFIKDNEEILKVIQGKIKRKKIIEKKYNDNELPLKIRIERMKNMNNDFEIKKFNLKFFNKKIKEEFGENDNEELKDAFNDYKENTIRQIEKVNNFKIKELKERMKENNKILENIILLNKKNKREKKNNLFIKGNNLKVQNNNFFTYTINSYTNSINSFLRNNQKNKNYENCKVNSSIEIKNLSSLFIRNNY